MADQERTLIALALLLGTTDAPVRGDQFQSRRLGELWDAARQLERQRQRIGLSALDLTDPEMDELGALCLAPHVGAMRLGDMRTMAVAVVDRWLDFEARKQIGEAMREHEGRSLVLDLLQRCARIDAGESTDVTRIEDVTAAIWGEVNEAWERPAFVKPRGVPTGIPRLDEQLTFLGLPRGHVTVLGGATSAGKSALANTCLLSAARQRMSVLIVALEDDAKAVATRTLSTISGVQNRALQRREVTPSQRDRFSEAVAEASSFHVAFFERTPSAAQLGQSIRSYCLQQAVDLVIVDYLQLVPSGINARSRQEHIDHVLEQLVATARALPQTATLIVSQLHRTKGEVPTKESLYHSGAIEQWAHTIALLWRPETKEPSRCVGLLVEKQKNGPTGLVVLKWDPEHVCFGEPEYEEAARFEAEIGRMRRCSSKS